MIPADIDHRIILAELNEIGWKDYKIDMACGFSNGYCAQLKKNIRLMTYQRAARLYNFWEDETRDLQNQLSKVTINAIHTSMATS